MEEMIVWKEAENIHEPYDILKIIDDEDGLKIFLSCKNKKNIIVSYDTIVCSYMSTEESFFIKGVEKLINRYGLEYIAHNTFFVVQNSDYLNEIDRNTSGALRLCDLFHLRIVSINHIMDIISFGAPTIRETEDI